MVVGQVSKMIGATVKRKEDPRLISGEGRYTADVQLSGMAYMMVLRSPHAHAIVRRIDSSKAELHPGVLAVVSGEEVNGKCQGPLPLFALMPEMKFKDRWPMATSKVNFVGEAVAAVVADSPASARNTLNKGSEGFSGGYWGSFAEILRPPGLFSQMCRPLISLRRGRCNL